MKITLDGILMNVRGGESIDPARVDDPIQKVESLVGVKQVLQGSDF